MPWKQGTVETHSKWVISNMVCTSLASKYVLTLPIGKILSKYPSICLKFHVVSCVGLHRLLYVFHIVSGSNLLSYNNCVSCPPTQLPEVSCLLSFECNF